MVHTPTTQDTATELLDMDTQGTALYDYIAETIKEMSGAMLVAISTVEEENKTSTSRSIAGIPKMITQISSIMGMNANDYQIEIEPDTYSFLSSGDFHRFDSLYALTLGTSPKVACDIIQSLFQIGEVYQIGFTRQGKVFGGASLMFHKRRPFTNKDEVRTFVRQAAIALHNKKAEDRLRESEFRYRNIFENAMIGLYRSNQQGDLLMANHSFCRMFGFDDLEEFRAMKAHAAYPRPELRNRYVHEMEKKGFVDQFENVGVNRDGETVYFLESAKKVVPANGDEPYYEGVVTDITRMKQLHKQLNTIADIQSHKLRGPLASVMGLLNIIVEEEDPAQQKEYARMMLIRAKELDSVIHRVVNLSQTAEGLSDLDPDNLE